MPRKTLSLATRALTLAALLLSLTTAYASDTERVLYSANGVNVATPFSLTVDASGNLYGVGGPTPAHEYGSIFRLSKGPAGHWNMTVLYEFRGAADGDGPNGNLVFDSAGNLYGTTIYKGDHNCSCGTVFELSPTPSGPWKETTLYSFMNLGDGREPYAGVIFDLAGNLYGTTSVEGSGSDCGTVFELSPSSGGTWTETTIHTFQCGNDGFISYAPLVFDQKGNLYGTTADGGGKNTTNCPYYGCGAVFELTPNSGSWTEKVLYAFGDGNDGGYPEGPLVMDMAGNLYGTAAGGGNLSACGGHGCGAVFELSPSADDVWTESIPYAFTGGNDGQLPTSAMILTRAGSLFGVTEIGGPTCDCGTVFEVSPNSEGGWTEKVLYAFAGGNDGSLAFGDLILDKQGSLYGTTYEGGTDNQGTVFKLIP